MSGVVWNPDNLLIVAIVEKSIITVDLGQCIVKSLQPTVQITGGSCRRNLVSVYMTISAYILVHIFTQIQFTLSLGHCKLKFILLYFQN